jgi:hypothetical protein
MSALGEIIDNQGMRIAQLERQLQEMGQAIAMSAVALGLLHQDPIQTVVTVDDAMQLMERIGCAAEKWLAYDEFVNEMFKPDLMYVGHCVALRRDRIERERAAQRG